jgi:phosphoenolpyruvate carboxylase
MTDDDNALLGALTTHPEAVVRHTASNAKDRIEAQAAEIERLRAALKQIARLRTDLSGDFSLGSYQSDIARAALGETE